MKRLIMLIVFFVTIFSFAQSPGGVGSSNISLWYRGDDTGIVETSGAFNWPDGSGGTNIYDAYQNTLGVEPTQTNLFNFNETYTFNGTSNYLAIEDLSYTAGQVIDNLYGFVVYSSESEEGNNLNNNAFLSFGRAQAYSMALRGNGRLAFAFRDVDNSENELLQSPASSNANDGNPHIATFIFEEGAVDDTKIRFDGRIDIEEDKLGGGLEVRNDRFGFIGDESNASLENDSNSGNYFDGDIAEIILYDQSSAMALSDLVKIETYLALKYGVTLDNSDGSDAGDYVDSGGNTIWDASDNSDYHNAVGGIINDETVGAIHQKISKPLNSYLTITTGITSGTVHDFVSENNVVSRTNVISDTYLMFGENNAPFGFDECGVSSKMILNKKWLFKESSTQTNNVFIAISEDLFPSGATVEIIVSDDDTFDGSDVTVSLTNSGGVYYTTSSIDIDNDDRVSFLIDEEKIAGVSLGKIDLHIKADENSIVDGKLTLTDASLGLSDAVENEIDNRPGTSDLMNFNSTLTFDGEDDYLYIKNKHYTDGDEISNIHAFTVFSTDFNDGGARTNSSLIDFDRIGGPLSNYIRGDGKLVYRYRSNASNKTETGIAILNDGIPHISEVVFDSSITSGNPDTFVKYDGVLDDSDEKEDGNIILDKTRYGIIGDESNDDQENGNTRGVYFDGKISEIILTDTEKLDANEIIQIESYLALKYGVTLDNSIVNYLNSSGTVVWDDTESDYWNGIAGIIKDDDDSDLDQRIAQSSSAKDLILATTLDFISANSDGGRTSLNEGSFLLFGNNGETAGGIETNASLSKSITSRHWLFNEGGTNLNDNVFVAIPKSYFPEGSTSVTAHISSDDTFDSGDTSVTLIDDGTYYYFSRDIDDGEYLAYSLTPPIINGPGNVSNGLTMWIKADKSVTSSGDILTSIVDASLNGNNVTQSDNTFKPTINQSETNYNPTISFDTQRLAIENLNYNGVGVIEKIYAWVIYKTDHFDESTNEGVDDKNASFISFDRREYFNMQVRGDGKLSMLYRDSGDVTRSATGTEITNTGVTQLGGFIFDNSLTDETILRLNGVEDFKDDLSSTPIGTNDDIKTRFGYVGDGSDASVSKGDTRNRYYEGAISEIIYYEGETLDSDEIRRIESYLAIKYGVTLDGDYIDSVTPTANIIWDATLDLDYNNDIAIIGRDDDSELYQKQSKSENSDGVLTISADNSITASNEENGGVLSNLAFLAWGNNSTEESFVTDCSATTLKVNKTWMVQNTGSVGAVTMQFDMTNIPDPGSYELVIDIDDDFTTTAGQSTASGILSDSDTKLTFSSITLTDGVYFSLIKSSASDITYNGSWSGGSGTGGAPNESDLGKRVSIENSVTLTESFKCNCLEIDASQTLTVPTEKYISANQIVLNGDIYLEGTAELIQTDVNVSNSGTGQLYKIVDEATDSQYRYNFFSAPVNTSGIFTIADNLKFNTGGDLSINTDPTFTDDENGSGTTISREWLYGMNNVTSFSRINENTTMNPGIGFTMKGTGSTNKYNFIGSPNNGEITVAVDENNYVLTGNPYPSTINIDTFNANMLSDDLTDGTVYLWDQPTGSEHATGTQDDVGGYATRVNGVGTVAVTLNDDAITGAKIPTAFIKPGQGFIVTGTDDDASIKFTNALRNGIDYITEAEPAHFYRIVQPDSKTSRSIIRLGFEYTNDENKIFHRQLATVLEDYNLLEKEVGKDAYMFDYYDNDAYWVLPNDDSRFVITSVPSLTDNEDLELPIGVTLDQPREITIKLDDVKNIDRNIYLIDHDLGLLTDIEHNDYKVLVNTGDNRSRFSLVFREVEFEEKQATLNSNNEIISNEINVYTDKNSIHVTQGNESIINVKLFDFTGKKLIDFENNNLNSSPLSISTQNINSQLVIVKVVTTNQIITKRTFINH